MEKFRIILDVDVEVINRPALVQEAIACLPSYMNDYCIRTDQGEMLGRIAGYHIAVQQGESGPTIYEKEVTCPE